MKKRLFATLTICLALSGAAYFYTSQAPTASDSSDSHASEAMRRGGVRFARGMQYVYDAAFHLSSRVDLPKTDGSAGSSIAGQIALTGKLTVSALNEDASQRLLLELNDIDNGTVRVAGTGKDIHATELNGTRAMVSLDRSGTVTEIEIQAAPGSPGYFAWSAIAPELSLTLRGDRSQWRATELTNLGEANSDYTIHTGPSQDFLWKRVRVSYNSMSGNIDRAAQVELVSSASGTQANNGPWKKVSTSETVRSLPGTDFLPYEQSVRLDLSLIATESGEPAAGDLAGWNEHVLDPLIQRQKAYASMLANRAGGLTVDELVATLQSFSDGTLPDHARFLWRSVALLQLDPATAELLKGPFLDDSATPERRALVLDLLASAGHPAAQAVLVDLLKSDAAKADPRAHLLVQRLSFVDRPTEESVAYLEDLFQSSDESMRASASYTLGSAVEGLHKQGKVEAANALNRKLRAQLHGAQSDEERVHAVRSLANSADPQNAREVLHYAESADPAVREAVAYALADLKNPDTKDALLIRVADTNPQVQNAALRSLATFSLSADDLARITGFVTEGAIHKTSYGQLVQITQRHMTDLPAETASLSGACIALRDLPRDLRSQLEEILLFLQAT